MADTKELKPLMNMRGGMNRGGPRGSGGPRGGGGGHRGGPGGGAPRGAPGGGGRGGGGQDRRGRSRASLYCPSSHITYRGVYLAWAYCRFGMGGIDIDQYIIY